MGHRVEIHRRFHSIVGYRLDVLAMIISLGLLGIAMKALPVGTAYSVWVGVGAVGTVVLGIVLLGEPASVARMISVAFILAGIVGLKLSTA
jgi:quaternary ammonium compound-resistance protein SugE